MTLFHGTMSDSFGRRPVILVNPLVFLAASVDCALAANFEQLLLFQCVQGLSAGSGIVVGCAIIRDSLEGHGIEYSFLLGFVAGVSVFSHSAITLAGMAILAALGWWSWMLYVLLDALRRVPA